MDSENIIVRLAESAKDIQAAQRLRYSVFYEEGGAIASPAAMKSGLDIDIYDQAADHLIAFFEDRNTKEKAVIGTYRLLQQSGADKIGQFYTSQEFDISVLLNSDHNLLELGRSCVAKEFRTKAVLQKLWSSITSYVFDHNITMMMGCASLPGTDIEKHRPLLEILHHNHLAPPEIRPQVLHTAHAIRFPDTPLNKAVTSLNDLKTLPPLIKGYLRLGAYIGNGAMIDTQFNTTDICITLPVQSVSSRYADFYGRQTTRRSKKEIEYV